MPHLFVLFEHAAGYALFKSSKYKDIDKFRKDIQSNLDDLERFQEIMKFAAFSPFKNTRHALENMQDIANGSVNEDLKVFLENHISKKDKYVIGVNDKTLGSSLTVLGYTCSADGAVHDLIRGIRTYFHNLIEGFEDVSEASKSQLGLGHYYSRSRVKFNVNRVDNMIIQSISLLDQLDKDINTFVMRVREWYSLHFPELLQIVPENTVFIQCVNVIKNRKDIDGLEEELENVLHDSSKVQKIMVLARSSMGMDIGGPDLENVYHFVDRIIALSQKRKEILEYLKAKMSNVAPNLAALIGDVVGARLIAHSGSLTNLAKAPASTVQILGAEKALFRALKTRGNTPKFGLLFHTRYIAKAAKQNKGRISRYLANKCSVACRIDCFRENPTNVFGETLKDLVENRLKFYETGEIPPKNVDVMSKAVDKVSAFDKEQEKAEKKQQEKAAKKAKKKLRKSMENSFEMNGTNEALDDHIYNVQTPELKKKKKSKGKLSNEGEMNETIENAVEEVQIPEIRKKKKKKSKGKLSDAGEMNETVEDAIDEEDATVQKKKRKLQESSFEVEEEISPKKKKKSKHLF